MTIQIETLPPYRIAYMRQVGPYGPDNIQTMTNLKAWALTNKLLTKSSIILGISHDNPDTTLPENCRYDAAIVLSDDVRLDKSVEESKLPGGKYAILKLQHTAEDIQNGWNEIFSQLDQAGYQIDERPAFERYIEEMVSNHHCEICIPVK